MNISLKPPQGIQQSTDTLLASLEDDFKQGKVKLSLAVIDQLEIDLRRMVERWKEGTSVLRERLRKNNDLMEGVTEEIDFPWVGASSVTMGVAPGEARTLAATFDRALFGGETYLTAETISATQRIKSQDIEAAVNWLGKYQNNLLDTLRDLPIPIFRDGTVPVMGEWRRQIEKAVDYKTYQTAAQFQEDYPDADSAGMDEKRYNRLIKHLNAKYDPDLTVEYVYDEVVYDAPFFSKIPLARFLFYPLSIEDLSESIIYGKQYFEGCEIAKQKAERGEYDEEPAEVAIRASRGAIDDMWGHSREAIEGLSSEGDDYKRLECYRIVLKQDLDKDNIPEKYLLTYEHQSHRILKIQRYNLRKNIDNVVLFGFLKRDGRLLHVALCSDAYDQFRMIDDMHRHRQNVRAITDCPAFIAPKELKDDIDFGSGDYAWRPGVTIYLPTDMMAENKSPRQLITQNLSRDNNSLDEEGSVMRYLEIRIGPTQGMSGKETMNDPKQPATKTLALMRQATFRIDAYINEFKRSVPRLVALHNALYYQYGPKKIKYIGKVSGETLEMELEKALFSLDSMAFHLKIGELALSPEFQIEKAQALLASALQNPVVAKAHPEILISAWNEMVNALRPMDMKRFIIQAPDPSVPQMPDAMQGMPPEMPALVAKKMQELKNGKGMMPARAGGMNADQGNTQPG